MQIDFPPASLAPLTERAAVSQFTSARNVMRPPSFEERNVAPGVPLDVTTGIPEWDRLMLSFRNAQEDQLRYLRTKYGEDKVRRSDSGDWIVRVDDPTTGKSKDILADPKKLDLGDFVALAGDVPEIAGWVLAEKGAGSLPLLGRLKGVLGVGRDIVAGSAGAEAGGATKDIAVRAGRVPLNLQEIYQRRLGQFEADVGVGLATVPIQRFIQWTKSPFLGGRDVAQIDAITAQRHFREVYGLDIPLTVGQLTGNPDIIRREKFTGKVLGGSAKYQEFERSQQEAMRKLQSILMGDVPADDAVLGQQILDELKRKTAPYSEGVEQAAAALSSQAQANLQGLLMRRSLASGDLSLTQIGDWIREKLVTLRDTAKAEADRLYGEVRAITGDTPFIAGEDLAKAATDIKRDAASAFKEKATGLVSVSGTPIMRVTQVPSTAFVPEASVMRRLNELIANREGKYRFSDLQRMRTEVYDDLSKSEAVPGMGAHYLSRIGKALTEAMDKSIEALPDPRAKAALEAANKHYREKVVPFSEKGIDELFRKPDEPGHVGSAQIASRLMSGPSGTDRYNQLKRVLGTGSMELWALNRGIIDELLFRASSDSSRTTLDARKFLKEFGEFITNPKTREIAKEVIGPRAQSVMEQARFMIRAQEGSKFPAEETRALLASGSPTVGKLQDLMRAEAAKDDLFKSHMLKAIAQHKTSGLDLTPEDVVNRFINKPERNIKELTEVMALLSDRHALVEDIRTKYLESIFAKADESGVTYAQALAKAGGQPKARVILGNKLFDELEQFGMLRGGIEFPRRIAEQAGAMAGGTRIDRLLTHPMRTISTAIREWATATVLTSPAMRRWVSNINPSEVGTLQLIVTSAPFVEALNRNFGVGRDAQNVAQAIKTGLDESLKAATSPQLQRQPGVQAPAAFPSPPTPDMFKRSATNKPQAKTGNDLTPAIQVSGRVFTGKDHVSAYAKAKESGQPDTSGAREGFVDAQGRFISREDAAARTGLPTNTEPGKLHSSDLPTKRKD